MDVPILKVRNEGEFSVNSSYQDPLTLLIDQGRPRGFITFQQVNAHLPDEGGSPAMVDELGGLEEAINGAAKLAGLETPPRVLLPRRRFTVPLRGYPRRPPSR